MAADYLTLLSNPLFWRQLAVGVVVLTALLVFKFIYKKLKWTVLFLLLGLLLALVYGQFFFATYGTEGERAEVVAEEETLWQEVRGAVTGWLWGQE